MTPAPVPGWYPVRLERRSAGEWRMHWQNLMGVPFMEPFFEDTLRQARAQHREERTTVIDPREETLSPIPAVAAVTPTAFLFHASRCGSTLLTQLLTSLPGCVALSEPPILDDVLQLPDDTPLKPALLKEVIRLLGQRREDGDRHFVLKYDSWHLPWFSLIHRLFPGTPCFFVYRHPVEILWSHHRQRGSQMVPGLRDAPWLGPAPAGEQPGDLDAYAARVLESFFSRALPLVKAGRLIPLEHPLLVRAPQEAVARLGLKLTATEEARIRERSQFHSKRQWDAYQTEHERHIPTELSERLEALAARMLMPAYELLARGSAGMLE